MRFWHNLRQSALQSLRPVYVKLHDEERLGPELDPGNRQQQETPKKAAIYRIILLINLAMFGLLLRKLEPLITLLRCNERLFSPHVFLPNPETLHYNNETFQQNRIPLILHQTTATKEIPDRWVQSQETCKKAYSEFEYKLWTDHSARDFLSEYYSWFVPTWDSYAFPIQRADAIRYFVLYHYGGIYLDMDTRCNNTLPAQMMGSDQVKDYALFKPTRPTGVTNDLLVASPKHPIYKLAISKLPVFHSITRSWARFQPYCAIMISAGPLFLTMVVKEYLLEQHSLPSNTIGVVEEATLSPYITDLQSGTWHQADAKILMWMGERPWVWFALGTLVLVAGLYVIDRLMLLVYARFRGFPSEFSIKSNKKA
ncbi:unnamed protein product [Penicillium pancosmium]